MKVAVLALQIAALVCLAVAAWLGGGPVSVRLVAAGLALWLAAGLLPAFDTPS